MKNTIAKALWLVAGAAMAASGCKQTTSTKNESVPAVKMPAPVAGENEAQNNKSEAADTTAADRASSDPKPTSPTTGARYKIATKARTSAAGALAAPMRIRPAPPAPPSDQRKVNSEAYKNYGVNPMVDTEKDNLSTFAVDVDTASYAIARKKILTGHVPPAASVRVEEFVNYFRYDYDGPKSGQPFAVHLDAAPSPFTRGHHLLRVGVQAKKLSIAQRKKANLVFLVDVSGSMGQADKLPLAKRALRVLVNNLKDGDTVALVTYASGTRVVLEPTGVEHKAQIFGALEDLRAGGSTAMSSGLQLAYDLAAKNLDKDTISRVIVMSDGDANVGRSNHKDILKTIAGRVKEGVTLSTFGFGMGNYKDTMMEQLANKGNGTNYYIDSLSEAKKVFQEQLGGTLEVVAKDVKIQVDFNKNAVKSYRLIGYENRNIADRDFRNDKVDAGEIGAGHRVTALYEVKLANVKQGLATVRIRAKKPRGRRAVETAYRFDLDNLHASFDDAPSDFRFATAVMATAEKLRKSKHAANWRLATISNIARAASAKDNPERQEFLALLGKIEGLKSRLATR